MVLQAEDLLEEGAAPTLANLTVMFEEVDGTLLAAWGSLDSTVLAVQGEPIPVGQASAVPPPPP